MEGSETIRWDADGAERRITNDGVSHGIQTDPNSSGYGTIFYLDRSDIVFDLPGGSVDIRSRVLSEGMADRSKKS